jgi:DNA-binding NarL/FixJ family response regulator
MIKILHAENHKLLYEGIKALLKESQEMKIVGYASTTDEVLNQLSLYETDVLVLDDNLLQNTGTETISFIKKDYKNIKIVVHSICEKEENLLNMFDAGVDGYILKKSGMEDLIGAIKKVSVGGQYICCDMALEMLEKLKESKKSTFNRQTKELPKLSEREYEVLKLISEGLTNEEISNKLFTSRRTVETHRRNLIEKTQTRNTATLIKFAIFNNIIQN